MRQRETKGTNRRQLEGLGHRLLADDILIAAAVIVCIIAA